MKSFEHLRLERKQEALWIILDRPFLKNAFHLKMAEELLKAIRQGMKDKTVATIILSGNGDAFSAGGDIKQMSETKNPKQFFLDISRIIHRVVLEIRKGPKSVLAVIPGYVGGIAFGLILAADLRFASEKAQFCAATIRLGLVANGSATYHLPRIVGLTQASEIFLLGETLSAQSALKMGLINRVFEHEKLHEETQKIADQLAKGPRRAQARLKKILNDSLTAPLTAQMERERQSIAWSATTSDFKEGIRAFLEKRKPVFNQ